MIDTAECHLKVCIPDAVLRRIIKHFIARITVQLRHRGLTIKDHDAVEQYAWDLASEFRDNVRQTIDEYLEDLTYGPDDDLAEMVQAEIEEQMSSFEQAAFDDNNLRWSVVVDVVAGERRRLFTLDLDPPPLA